MKTIKTFDVTFFGNVCGIKAKTTICAFSLNDLRKQIRLFVNESGLVDVGPVMAYLHAYPGRSIMPQLYYAASIDTLNFKRDTI